MVSTVARVPPFCQILWKSVEQSLLSLANKKKLTNTDKNINLRGGGNNDDDNDGDDDNVNNNSRISLAPYSRKDRSSIGHSRIVDVTTALWLLLMPYNWFRIRQHRVGRAPGPGTSDALKEKLHTWRWQ